MLSFVVSEHQLSDSSNKILKLSHVSRRQVERAKRMTLSVFLGVEASGLGIMSWRQNERGFDGALIARGSDGIAVDMHVR